MLVVTCSRNTVAVVELQPWNQPEKETRPEYGRQVTRMGSREGLAELSMCDCGERYAHRPH